MIKKCTLGGQREVCDSNLYLKPKYSFIYYLLFLFNAFILFKSNESGSEKEKFDSVMFWQKHSKLVHDF